MARAKPSPAAAESKTGQPGAIDGNDMGGSASGSKGAVGVGKIAVIMEWRRRGGGEVVIFIAHLAG